jgi:hypothetical protein
LQAIAVAEAGYFAAAPNQRCYGTGARPDPGEPVDYAIDAPIDDAMAIVAWLGHGERRFTSPGTTGVAAYCGTSAAEGTAEFIAAPYTFAPLAGIGHYAADQAPNEVNTLMLAHLARHPV